MKEQLKNLLTRFLFPLILMINCKQITSTIEYITNVSNKIYTVHYSKLKRKLD